MKPDPRPANFVLNRNDAKNKGTREPLVKMASFFVDGRFTDAWVVDRTLFEHLSGVRRTKCLIYMCVIGVVQLKAQHGAIYWYACDF